MRVPIAVALAHPDRIELDLPRLELADLARLDFEPPDRERFPCLDLAYRAVSGSEAAPAVLNAANEVAVAAFLERRIDFPEIAELNAAVLGAHLKDHLGERLDALEAVLAADEWARRAATDWLAERSEGDAGGASEVGV
jgi:1-deoxy-D-xylulose-5-phosphate reductoisomerase